jgi:error-prone DNA polymerase
MTDNTFVHLHVHSNFSFLDGATPPERLLERAAELGMSALALTDHHGLYGAVRFLQVAAVCGVKPILGIEVEVQGSRFKVQGEVQSSKFRVQSSECCRGELHTPVQSEEVQRSTFNVQRVRSGPRSKGEQRIANSEQRNPKLETRNPQPATRNPQRTTHNAQRAHLVLLAKNRTGYASLCRIVTKAQLEHQDDPHIALEDLAPLARDVIALLGCPRGQVAATLPRSGSNLDEAVRVAGQYAEIFGRENFWIELEHHLLPGDDLRNQQLVEVARRTGLRWVITNDVHYARPEEYRLRDVMACIQTNTTLDGFADIRHRNAEYYLKTAAQLRQAFHGLPKEVVDAGLAATAEIAARCDLSGDAVLANVTRAPAYDVPEGETPFSYLYSLCNEGLRRKYQPMTPEAVNRLAYELNVVEQMDLSEFFLCVWDMVRFSRERGIRCAGRGSAADSIIAYVLDITTVDPLANNLLFDRFLNPGRVGMPDVDIDFDSRRRDEVIEYVENKYGPEHSAMVANLVTYRSRSAFRDVAKAMGYPPGLIDHIASSLSYRSVNRIREDLGAAGIDVQNEDVQRSTFNVQREEVQSSEFCRGELHTPVQSEDVQSSKFKVQGEDVQCSTFNVQREPNVRATFMTPEQADPGPRQAQRTANNQQAANSEQRTANSEQPTANGQQPIANNPKPATHNPQPTTRYGQLETIIHLCEQLDGYPRHLSLHNGGMLITREPLVDIVPIEYATSGVRVCQFNKDDVEALGLIKFDILGLRTLSIVGESVAMIKEARNIDLPIDDLPLDDPAVYDFICTSKTIGVFQIESPGQWNLLQRAQPRTFGDLIIQIALFRPGPLQGGMVDPYIERRCGREAVTYMHPSLEDALRDTLGVVIFQEQVLQVAHDFAGLSYAEADGLRRAMSHYRTEAEMDVCRTSFVESAVRKGRDRALAEEMYKTITYFSGYGFCRSHAAAFAKTVYQTAFLKTYFPAELLAAILSNEPCCYYPTQTVIEDARHWGIEVLPVDVNRSRARYGVEVQGSKFKVQSSKFKVQSSEFNIQSSGFCRGELHTPVQRGNVQDHNAPRQFRDPQPVPPNAQRTTHNAQPATRNPQPATRNPQRGSIRMGFLQVKGLSEDVAETIVAARKSGSFRSLTDFWRRTSVDRDALQNLIAVGAFDSLGIARRKLLWQMEEVIKSTPRLRKLVSEPITFNGQRSTFNNTNAGRGVSHTPSSANGQGARIDPAYPTPSPKPTTRNPQRTTHNAQRTTLQVQNAWNLESDTLLQAWDSEPLPDLPALTELDLAGLDMTLQNASARYSVMSFHRRSLKAAHIMSIGEVQTKPNGVVLKTAGIVISRQQPPTAKGMTFLVLSDEEGELPAAVPPQVYQQYRRTLSSSASLVVEGTLQRYRLYVTLMVKRMWNLREVAQLDAEPYRDPALASQTTTEIA